MGIDRLDLVSKKYQAIKVLHRKQHAKTFLSLRDAKHWLKTFVNPNQVHKPIKIISLKEIINLYSENHISNLSQNSRQTISQRINGFFDGNIQAMPLADINHEFIDARLKELKTLASQKRSSFYIELKITKSLFNWYIENYNSSFPNPIKKRHYLMCKVKASNPKRRKLNKEEILRFFSNLSGVYLGLAKLQFFTASRISEAAGLHWGCIDIDKSILKIKYCLVWSRQTKKFLEIKELPKNNKERFCPITPPILEVLKNREVERIDNLVFHIDGEPLSYRQIQHEYQKALKKSNLSDVTSTHFLRHSSANILRGAMGLDIVQALTGHSSRSIVEKVYTEMPGQLQIEAGNALYEIISSKAKNTEKVIEG